MDEELQDLYNIYAGFGNRSGPLLLDGSKFAKLCRDCNVQDALGSYAVASYSYVIIAEQLASFAQ